MAARFSDERGSYESQYAESIAIDYENLMRGDHTAIRNLVELNLTLFSKIEALEIETRAINKQFQPTLDRLADVESELNNLKHENQQLKFKLASTEDATKSLFLRIDGLSELNNENLVERVASTFSLTGVQCNALDIDHVHRIGRFKQGHTRSISVRFIKEGVEKCNSLQQSESQ